MAAALAAGIAAACATTQPDPTARQWRTKLADAIREPVATRDERDLHSRVLMNAVAGKKLRIYGAACTPVRVRGWSNVVFRRDADGSQMVVPIDALTSRLDEWERGA